MLSQETKGHTGAGIYCLRDQDQRLSQRIPASHCRQKCHQDTGQQATGNTGVWNPHQVAGKKSIPEL